MIRSAKSSYVSEATSEGGTHGTAARGARSRDQTHDWPKPYPGESQIVTPDRAPGGFVPPAESD